MTSLTVTAAADETDFWGTKAEDMQSSLTVGTKKITGTLKKLTTGQLVTDWGEGYFMALQFDADDFVDATSVKVGLTPSEGSGLVELLGDPDMNGVFKVTDKSAQKFTVQITTAAKTESRFWDLSELTLED